MLRPTVFNRNGIQIEADGLELKKSGEACHDEPTYQNGNWERDSSLVYYRREKICITQVSASFPTLVWPWRNLKMQHHIDSNAFRIARLREVSACEGGLGSAGAQILLQRAA